MPPSKTKTRTQPKGRIPPAPRIDPLQLFTEEQAAAALQISRRTLQTLLSESTTPPKTCRVGSRTRILGADLLDWLAGNRWRGNVDHGQESNDNQSSVG